MVFKKKMMKKRPMRKMGKKPFARKAVAQAKTKSLVRLIKKVSLRQSETKDTHVISENLQLYHNVPYNALQLLYLEQGINDNETGTSQYSKRVGDEIQASGISLKLWIANKLDRPDITYKIIVFKYKSNTAVGGEGCFHVQGTANYMIRDLNTEKYPIVKVLNFRISTSAQRITATDTFQGAEGHKALKIWIPLKRRIKYEDGSSTPMGWDYGFTIVAYDSFGTLTTDNVSSFAVNRKLYFKDP